MISSNKLMWYISVFIFLILAVIAITTYSSHLRKYIVGEKKIDNNIDNQPIIQ